MANYPALTIRALSGWLSRTFEGLSHIRIFLLRRFGQ